MFRMLTVAIALPLLALGSPAAPAPAPKAAPTDLPVPAKALFVAQVQGVERVRGRLEAMLKAAAPDVAEAVAQQFEDALSSALDGRDISVLSPDARLFVVVTDFNTGGGEPPVAVLFPVKDYATFKEKLLDADERKTLEKGRDGVDTFDFQDKTVCAVDLTAKYGYVAVSPNRNSAELLAEKFAPLTPAQMGDAVGEAFLSADLSVFVNLEQVNDDYGDQIRQGRQLFQIILQQGAMMGGGAMDPKQMEIAKVMFDGLFQMVEDGRGLALGVTFKPEGLLIRGDAAFATGTETAKQLAKEQPAGFPGLSDLPAGMTTYSAAKMGPKLSEIIVRFNPPLTAEPGDDKAKEIVDKFLGLYLGVNAKGVEAAANTPDVIFSVAYPDDPAAIVEAETKAFKALTDGSAFQSVILKEKPRVTENAQKLRDFSFTETKLVLDFEATVKGMPDATLRETTIASMKKMLNEKMTHWHGTDGKRYITVIARDWETAEKLLTDYLDGKGKIGDQPAFAATRGELPAEASMLSLTDVPQLTVMMTDMLSEMSQAIPGFPFGELPKVKPAGPGSAYLGLALGVQQTTGRLDVFVPVEAVKVVRKTLEPLVEKLKNAEDE